jgi:hypothetical protein
MMNAMSRISHYSIYLLCTVSLLVTAPVTGSTTENYAGDFLMLGAGARSLGMGGSAVAVTGDATAVYHNPSGLTGIKTHEATLMHSEQFAGLINYNTVSFGAPLSETISMGITLLHSGIGDIKYTRLADPSQPMDDNNRPVVASLENATDYTLYAGAGRKMTNTLSIGAAVKVIRRSIGSDTAFGFGIDLGAEYHIQNQWHFGLSLRDATGTSIAWDGKADDRIAPTLETGIAAVGDVPMLGGGYVLTASMRFFGDTPDSKGLKTMDIGGEYLIGDYLAFRAGSHQGAGTFGLGVMRLPLISSTSFDYAFLADDGLDSTHRISLSVRF